MCWSESWFLLLLTLIVSFSVVCISEETTEDKKYTKDSWKKKDIRDYNDADMERLFDQWEEKDEPLEEDELPEHKRSRQSIDMSNLDTSNPESLMRVSKKGQTLMTFVKVSGNPTKKEADEITKIWQTGLMNSHINVDRYMLEDNRAIFMFKDGAQAFDAKEFLVEQEQFEEIVIDSKNYPGKYSKAKKTEL